MEFKDKIALVTGAASGIGQATCIRLLKSGAKVIMVDISKDLEHHVAKMSFCNMIKPIVADVTSESVVQSLVVESERTFGKIDILINCAGVHYGAGKSIMDFPDEVWDRLHNVLFKGTLYTCKHIAPIMIKNNYGRIINVSSIAGKIARPFGAPYSCPKAAVIHFTRILALELAKYNITVNAIAPGPTKTPLFMSTKKPTLQEKIEGNKEFFRIGIPNKRLAEPEEQADVIAFLALEKTRHITGQTIFVDGGESAV